MFTVLVTLWLLSVPLALVTFYALTYFEHKRYRGNWKKDGKPFSIFRGRSELKRSSLDFWEGFRGSTGERRLMLDWLFTTPAWVRGEPMARLLLYAYRCLVMFWCGGFFVVLALLDKYYW